MGVASEEVVLGTGVHEAAFGGTTEVSRDAGPEGKLLPPVAGGKGCVMSCSVWKYMQYHQWGKIIGIKMNMPINQLTIWKSTCPAYKES